MRATGIVRRVDDMGRIVLPKELRDAMRISAGTPLEIFADGDHIILRPFHPEIPVIEDALKVLSRKLNAPAAAFDPDGILIAAYDDTMPEVTIATMRRALYEYAQIVGASGEPRTFDGGKVLAHPVEVDGQIMAVLVVERYGLTGSDRLVLDTVAKMLEVVWPRV